MKLSLPAMLIGAALLLWLLALGRIIGAQLTRLADVPVAATRWHPPLFVQLRWPLALLCHLLGPRLPLAVRLAVSERLQRAGLARFISVAQYVAMQCLLLLIATSLMTVVLVLTVGWRWWPVVAAAVFGWLLPRWLLARAIRRRRRSMLQQLPGYRERLQAAGQCGCHTVDALRLAIDWGGRGPLRTLLQRLLGELQEEQGIVPRRQLDVSMAPAPVAVLAWQLRQAHASHLLAEHAYHQPRTWPGPGFAHNAGKSAEKGANYLINEEYVALVAARPDAGPDRLLEEFDDADRGHAGAPPD